MKQLTDDVLFAFTRDLSNFIEEQGWFESDETYDELQEFVFLHLDKYSNGYVNHN